MSDCYVKYVEENVIIAQIEQKKQELVMQTSLVLSELLKKQLLVMPVAGMCAFPKPESQTSDYISEKLYAYKNREQAKRDVINYVHRKVC